jgi:FAD/FMN-containing dehydrogenase
MTATRAEMPRNSAENSALAARLTREIAGDVYFDPFNRGRYATDASFYQIVPAGVVIPRSMDEALRALAIARDDGRVVTPRGGGTSQCGQTVNHGIVIDFSKHLNRIISLDVENRTCVVEPGIVLDDLNRQLKKHGLWFPVDVSTASRATTAAWPATPVRRAFLALRHHARQHAVDGCGLATAPCCISARCRATSQVNTPRPGSSCSATCSPRRA